MEQQQEAGRQQRKCGLDLKYQSTEQETDKPKKLGNREQSRLGCYELDDASYAL